MDNVDNLLDEDLNKKIKDVENELHSLDNPHAIKSGLEDIDPFIRNNLNDTLKTIPREDILKLIGSIGSNNLEMASDYKFAQMGYDKKQNTKNKLLERLSDMKNTLKISDVKF